MNSLKPYLLEETYELLDAMDNNEPSQHREELGDVLLQIVFQSQIASENDLFDANDVVDTLCRKLIRRHPHVFGHEHASTPAEVVKHWQRIKKEEKARAKNTNTSADTSNTPSNLGGIPASFPPMMAATKLSKQAATKGFDWESYGQVWKKLQEEMGELHEAMELDINDPNRQDEIAWEIGDVFFALVNLARHLNMDPSEALRQANNRFSKRFNLVKKMASQRGIEISDAGVDTLERLWEEAKAILKQNRKPDF